MSLQIASPCTNGPILSTENSDPGTITTLESRNEMMLDVDRYRSTDGMIKASLIQIVIGFTVVDTNQNVYVIVGRGGLEEPIHFREISIGDGGNLLGNDDRLRALRCKGGDLISVVVQNAHAFFARRFAAVFARVRGQ